MDWIKLFDGFLPTVGVIVVALINLKHGRWLKRIDTNSAASAEQTVNDHQDAKFPNLREEQTDIRQRQEQMESDLKAVRGLTHGIERGYKNQNKWLQDISSALEQVHDAIERKGLMQDRALQGAIEERTAALQDHGRRIDKIELAIPDLINQHCVKHLEKREDNG